MTDEERAQQLGSGGGYGLQGRATGVPAQAMQQPAGQVGQLANSQNGALSALGIGQQSAAPQQSSQFANANSLQAANRGTPLASLAQPAGQTGAIGQPPQQGVAQYGQAQNASNANSLQAANTAPLQPMAPQQAAQWGNAQHMAAPTNQAQGMAQSNDPNIAAQGRAMLAAGQSQPAQQAAFPTQQQGPWSQPFAGSQSPQQQQGGTWNAPQGQRQGGGIASQFPGWAGNGLQSVFRGQTQGQTGGMLARGGW